MAQLAAPDLTEAGYQVLGCLTGGLGTWKSAGVDLAAAPTQPADAACIDDLFFVRDRHDGNRDAARAYLAWETTLMAQMDAQETGVLKPLLQLARSINAALRA